MTLYLIDCRMNGPPFRVDIFRLYPDGICSWNTLLCRHSVHKVLDTEIHIRFAMLLVYEPWMRAGNIACAVLLNMCSIWPSKKVRGELVSLLSVVWCDLIRLKRRIIFNVRIRKTVVLRELRGYKSGVKRGSVSAI